MEGTRKRTFSTLIVLSTALLSVAGCASVQPVAPQVRVADSNHVFEKNYSLGVEAAVYVGEPIVKVKDYYQIVQTADALQASGAFTLTWTNQKVNVPAGSIADVVGTTSRHSKTYRVIAIRPKGAPRFLLNEDGSFEGSSIDVGGIKLIWTIHADPPAARFIATTVTKTDTSKGFKNFELIFSGVTKDSITVLYREYTPDDLARAAYSQSLVYPKESPSIRYRDIAITVIEASNERIRYVVKADGLK